MLFAEHLEHSSLLHSADAKYELNNLVYAMPWECMQDFKTSAVTTCSGIMAKNGQC